MNQNLNRRSGPQRPLAMRRPQNGAGNARQQYERYLARARVAHIAGDAVEMENYCQHAEHYFRVMGTASGPDPGKERSHVHGTSGDRL
jgi:Domain of unknown function (DUF4167)